MTDVAQLRADHQRETLERLDYDPLPVDQSARWARRYLEKLLGGRDELHDLERADPGICQDCHRHALLRVSLGSFTLCRSCAIRRRSVATRLPGQLTWDEQHVFTVPPTVPAHDTDEPREKAA